MAEKGDTRNDGELVAAVNGGDWGAFDLLYFRHREWVYRLAWRFCGDETDAHDAVQEVFVYLAGKFRAARGLELRAGLTTLLYPAVKHTAIGIARKRKRGGGPLGEGTDFPALPTQRDNARGELAEVIRTLSEAHREVVLMRFVDDMTLEEIGVALGIPVGTAKSRLHHALAALREDQKLRGYFESK